MAELTTGDDAPQFELPADGGGTVRLAELRGKIVVLFFYPQDDTDDLHGRSDRFLDASTPRSRRREPS